MISKRKMASGLLVWSGFGAGVLKMGFRGCVVSLIYHRIGSGKGSMFDPDLWSTAAEEFDRQVGLLKKDFDVILPGDLKNVGGKGRSRLMLITFDDGYRDNYETAFPILRAHGARATFFVSTVFLDRPCVPWWDEIAWMVRSSVRREVRPTTGMPVSVEFDEPERKEATRALQEVYKSLPGNAAEAFMNALGEQMGTGRYSTKGASRTWMTWDMVREMRAAGMCIGGHTVNHQILAKLSREGQRMEVMGCGKRLKEELGEPMRYFSYPRGKRGSFNKDTREILREAGVEMAFSNYGGFQRMSDWDPLDVRRTPVEMDMDWMQFQAKVAMPGIFA